MNEYRKTVIDPGDEVSKIAYRTCVSSYNNAPGVVVHTENDHFRGARTFYLAPSLAVQMVGSYENPGGKPTPPKMRFGIQTDGTGHVVQAITHVCTEESFRGASTKLGAMVFDDAAFVGGRSLVFSSVFDAKAITKENLPLAIAAFEGLGRHLSEQQIILFTGETAILRYAQTIYGYTEDGRLLIFNWNGSVLSLHHDRIRPRTEYIKPGLVIVGLEDNGLGANGATWMLDVHKAVWGEPPHTKRKNTAYHFFSLMGQPSPIYSRLLNHLMGWQANGEPGAPLVKICGGIHVTGGGYDKVKEHLPPGIGAHFHRMLRPPRIQRWAQELAARTNFAKTDRQLYRMLHAGYRGILITDQEGAKDIKAITPHFGIKARIIGHTIASKTNEIVIESRFMEGGQIIL